MAKETTLTKKQARAYEGKLKALGKFPKIAIGVFVVLFVLAFLPWLCIYNTDIPGAEILVNGWNAFFCGITGKLSTPGGLFGNMDTFNYFAASACAPLALYGMIAYLCFIVSCALELVLIFTKKHLLNCVAAVTTLGGIVFTILGYTAAMSVNQSNILVEYCQSNPACSVESYAIFTAVLAAVALVLNLIAGIKYFTAKKSVK